MKANGRISGYLLPMAITSVPVDSFLPLRATFPVLDVRSPGEYAHAHIPGAYSFPLFTDEERKVVGTAYKQESREEAIKIGLGYFGQKMRTMVTQAEDICAQHSKTPAGKRGVLVHCWRGGMRSEAIAWLLDLYGFKVYKLQDGYKAYRHWVIDHFTRDYNFRIIGGYTGSAKTEVLHHIKAAGGLTIDLEGIAGHKGSAFGGLDKVLQPRQEMFENLLGEELGRLAKDDAENPIWIEDESQRIGDLNLPLPLWERLRRKPVYFLDVPFGERLDYITLHYGKYSTESLLHAIVRIKKRLGGLETKTSVNALLEGDIKGCFSILLKYYDKHYGKGRYNRPGGDNHIRQMPCAGIDPERHAALLLNTIHDDTRIHTS